MHACRVTTWSINTMYTLIDTEEIVQREHNVKEGATEVPHPL
jgi:hypothetical protein